MSARQASGLLRASISTAQEALKTELRKADEKYRNGFEVQLEDSPDIAKGKVEEDRTNIKITVDRVRNEVNHLRNELDKGWQILDKLPADKTTTEEWRLYLRGQEENLEETCATVYRMMKMLRKREEGLNETLILMDAKSKIPPLLDYYVAKGVRQDDIGNIPRAMVDGTTATGKIVAKSHLLEVPKFSGKLEDWPAFWEAFRILVHETGDENIYKFNALKQSCEGRALALLKRFPSDGSAYYEAIDRLKSIYNNDNSIFKTLYDKLKAVKRAKESITDIRRVFNECAILTSQIERQGQEINCATFLTEVRYKFPKDVLEEVARRERDKFNGKITQMKDLIDVIEDYIITQEIILDEQPIESLERSFQVMKIDKSRPTCNLCNKPNHRAAECRTFNNMNARKTQINRQRLCFVCLGKGHSAKDCRNSGCRRCGKRHHESICTGFGAQDNSNRWQGQNSRRNFGDRSRYRQNFNNTRGRSFERRGSYDSRERNSFRRDNSGSRERNNRYDSNSRDRYRGRSRSLENYRSRNPNIRQGRSRSNERRERGFSPNGRRVEFSRANVVTSCANRLIIGKLPVYTNDHADEGYCVQVMFDTGSDSSFIERDLAKKMRLQEKGDGVNVRTTGFGGNKKYQECENVAIYFDTGKKNYLKINLYTTDKITEPVVNPPIDEVDEEFLHENRIINRMINDKPVEPKILIGIEHYYDLIDEKKGHIILPSGLRAVKTKLRANEWIIFGKQKYTNNNVFIIKTDEEIINSLTELEGIGILEKDESADEIIEFFKKTVKISESGEISVAWPWKDGKRKELDSNKSLAFSRFMNFLNAVKTQEVWKEIVKQMQEQEESGIIEETPEQNVDSVEYYIPYQIVRKDDSNTTKVRIVFDASSHLRGKISLNASVHQGPAMIPDLLGILLRARCAKNLLISDIAKAFLQIRLQEADRGVTKFFWLKDPSKPAAKNNIRVMQFCRIPFGVNASPFLLTMSIKFFVENSDASPWLKKAIDRDMYVDNLITSFDNLEEMKKKYTESKEIFNRMKMNLREFVTNNTDGMSMIPEKDRAKGVSQKLLGYKWFPGKDTLLIKIPTPKLDKKPTRRTAIQFISGIFDPCGLISPMLNEGKTLIPDLFGVNINWDTPLKCEIADRLRKFQEKVTQEKVEFKRFILPEKSRNHELIIFSDASKALYAATAYIRSEVDNGVKVALLMSKQRLAPRKNPLSIPRLELLGFWIASKIMRIILESLDITISKTVMLSDAQIVLAWVKKEEKEKVFVQNRIEQIRKAIREMQDKGHKILLGHTKTDENPADLATKDEFTFSELQKTIWYNGPKFLKSPFNEWPMDEFFEIAESENEVSLEAKMNIVRAEENDEHFTLSNLYFSNNWTKVKRQTRYCLIFIKKMIYDKLKSARLIFALQKALPEVAMIEDNSDFDNEFNLQQETIYILRKHQQKYEISENKLKSWKRGEDNLIFLDTRLGNSIRHANRRRIVINPKSRLGYLIIYNLHLTHYHCGLRTLLGLAYERYSGSRWNKAIRNTLRSCIRCRKTNSHSFRMPESPELPERRVNRSTHAFEHIGIDYCGPFYLRMEDNNITKSYVLLFTCLSSRLVHLEPTYSLETAEFILAFRRFVADFGCPTSITSDNGTTFKLADRIFKEHGTIERAISRFGEKRIKWYFNVAASPWQGGSFERMVGICKKALKNAIGKERISKSIFDTLLKEVRTVVNLRPLCYVDDEKDGSFVLRPIDLLIPEYATMKLNGAEHTEFENTLEQFREVKNYVNRFWDQWEKFYLPQRNFVRLRVLPKAVSQQIVPEEGEIVLVKNDNESRDRWKMGKVEKVYKGSDGNVRQADVRVNNPDPRKKGLGSKVLTRTINHLVPVGVEGTKKKNEENSTSEETKRKRRSQKGNKSVRFSDEEVPQTRYRTRLAAKREETNNNIRIHSVRTRPVVRPILSGNKNWLYYYTVLIFMMLITIGSTEINLTSIPSYEYLVQANSALFDTSKNYSDTHGNLTARYLTNEEMIGHLKKLVNETREFERKNLENKTRIENEKNRKENERLKKEKVRLDALKEQLEKDRQQLENDKRVAEEQEKPKLNETKKKGTEEEKTTEIPLHERQDVKQQEIEAEQEQEQGKSVRRNKMTTGQQARFNYQDHAFNFRANNKPRAEDQAVMKCASNGVILRDPRFVTNSTYKVCSLHYCVDPITATDEIEVDFPSHVTSVFHRITWRKRERGTQKFKILEIACEAKNYCEVIRCKVCLEALFNPHCQPIVIIIVTIIIFSSIIGICITCKYSRNVRMIKRCINHSEFMRFVRFSGYVVAGAIVYLIAGIRDLLCWCRRERRRRKNYRKEKKEKSESFQLVEFPMKPRKKSMVKKIKDKKERIDEMVRSNSVGSIFYKTAGNLSRMNSSNSLNSSKSVRFKSQSPSTRSTSSLFNWKPVKYGNIVIGICCIITLTQVESCDKFIPISHNEKTCVKDNCTITTAQELFISPMDKLICLVASDKNRIIAKITVEVDYAFKRCEKGPISYTFNSSIEIGHTKKCYGNSLCDANRCSNINKDTKIDEFGKTNEMIGESKCVTSSGGWNSGCWSFKEACLFYRIGVKKNDDKRFEVFECEHWSNEIVINVKVETGDMSKEETETHKYLLKEGEKDSILDFKHRTVGTVELISVEEGTPVNALKGKFVQDGTHISTVLTEGNFKPPLVCDEKSKCVFENTCECEIGNSQPFCECKNYDLFSLTQNGLPMITPHYHLILAEDNSPALKHFHPRAHIQIELSNTFDMSTNFNNETCEVTDYSKVTGCYNCYAAASFNISCKSKVRSSAMISCNNKEFIDRITCDEDGHVNQIRKRFNSSQVSQTCIISCGKKKKVIEITGTLFYQPPDIVRKLYANNSNYADNHLELHFLMPDFLNHMKIFMSNLTTIIGTTVIVGLILFLIFKYILPYVVKLVR